MVIMRAVHMQDATKQASRRRCCRGCSRTSHSCLHAHAGMQRQHEHVRCADEVHSRSQQRWIKLRVVNKKQLDRTCSTQSLRPPPDRMSRCICAHSCSAAGACGEQGAWPAACHVNTMGGLQYTRNLNWCSNQGWGSMAHTHARHIVSEVTWGLCLAHPTLARKHSATRLR